MEKHERIVTHVDGFTKVKAIGTITDGEFKGEYKFDKMTWGVVIPIEVKCEHPRTQREYIGMNLLRCKICGLEFQ